MRTALLLTVILLSTSLLWLVPTSTAENLSTSITLEEVGAFKHTNETYTTPAGIEYPVLYVGETFHLRGQFDDANGDGVADACLNVYVDREHQPTVWATVRTDQNGSFDWFSGDAEQSFSTSGALGPINGSMVGFFTVQVAYEPTINATGGCEAEPSPSLNASTVDQMFMLKSRVDLVVEGVKAVQPSGVDCEEGECSGVYAGGHYALELRVLHDRFDMGVADLNVSYDVHLRDGNGVAITSTYNATTTTNNTGHVRLPLNITDQFCCRLDGTGAWDVTVVLSPFYVSLNQEEAELNVEGSWPVSVVPFFDRDGDGVHDDFDGCPETPASAPVNSTGCEGDDDADGVANSDDACPNTPGDVTVDAVGCEQEKEVEVETIEVFTLDGYVAHGSDVSLVAFHPEGHEFATVYAGFCQASTCYTEPTATSTLGIWNTSSRALKFTKDIEGHVVKMDWHPDGSSIALVTSDNNVAVHSAVNGEELFSFMAARAHAGSLKFSPDGTMLAVVCSYDGDDEGRIEIYNATTGAFVQRVGVGILYNHNNEFYSVDWSPDGKRLLVGGFAKLLEYNVSDWSLLRVIHNVYSYVTEAAYSPDQNSIAVCIGWQRATPSLKRSGYAPSQVRVHDAESGNILWSYTSTSSCLDLAWSPDSSMVAFSHSKYDEDGSTINVFHAENGSKAHELSTRSAGGCLGNAATSCAKITSVDWHPNATYIVASQSVNNHGVYHWVLTTTPVVYGCTDFYSLNYNPIANQDDGTCFNPGDLDQGADYRTVPTLPVLVLGDRRAGAPAGYSIASHTTMFERAYATPNGACYEVAKSLLGPWHIVNLADNWIIDGSGYGNAVYLSDSQGNKPYDTLYKLDGVDCTTADIPSNVNPSAPSGGYVGGLPHSGSDVGWPAITDSNGGMNFGCLVLCTPGEWMVFLLFVGFVIFAVYAVISRVWRGFVPVNVPPENDDGEEIDAREEEAKLWLSSIESKEQTPPEETPPEMPTETPLEPIFLGWLDGVNEGDLAPSEGADEMTEQ